MNEEKWLKLSNKCAIGVTVAAIAFISYNSVVSIMRAKPEQELYAGQRVSIVSNQAAVPATTIMNELYDGKDLPLRTIKLRYGTQGTLLDIGLDTCLVSIDPPANHVGSAFVLKRYLRSK